MALKPVDTTIIMTVGPCIDDTDFKSLEESVSYDAAGMDISLIVEKADGTSAVTAITLTTGGANDWTHKDGGYYEVEITAAQNAEEGIAYLRGVCTGVLPFESPRYDIVTANIYDSWIKGTDNLQVDVTQLLGTAWLAPGVAGTPDVNAKQLGGTAQTGRDVGANVLLSTGTGAGQLDFTSGIVKSNLTQILAHLLTQTGTQLADGFEKFFDVGTPVGTINSLPAGAADAAGGLPISDAGGLDLDAKLANTNEVTAARMGALTDWIDGGRLDLILDIIAADTTTDIPAKLLKYIQLIARSDAAIATDNATELTAINADGGSGGGDFSNQADATEALRDRGDSAWTTGAGGSDRLLMVDTTIATLANQTSFTLASGSADDNAYNNCTIIIEDASTAAQKAVGTISAYTGATKTITLKYDPAIFTMATTDKIYILAENALKSTLANRQLNVANDGDIAGNIDGSVASLVGHTAQTGDSFARIGAAGASLTDLGGMSTGMKAEVESEANDALVAQKLDHLVAVADADDPVNDSIISKLAASDGDWSGFDKTTDALEALRDRGDAAWITGGGGSITDILNIQALIPNSIDLANTATVRIGLGLTNMVDDLPDTAEITPGTITIDRKAIGGTSWSNVVNAAACSELAGLIYYDEVFDSGTGYAAGDSIRVTFKSQKITVSANDYEITGTDGWVFQTYVREAMRGTDSANTIVPDAAGVAPTAAEIRQEIDSNSTRLDADISSRAPASEYAGDIEDIRTLLGDGGNVFYVSKTGDNSDGTTWAKAKNTVDSAIALCTADHCDKIYIGCGTYDETANGATGVAVDVEGIKIIGSGMPTIKNTNTTANGNVFTVTATNTIIENVFVTKGETTSDGATCIHVNGAYVTCDIRGVMIAVEKTTHTGVKFNGGAIACSYMDTDDHLAHIYSMAGDGVGIDFADCSGCIVMAPHLHDLTTGIYFSGGADCEFNVLSPDTMILNCDTAITLDAGAHSNALSANIINCTTNYADNSGVDSNKADGSLTFVLDDIKSSIVEASPQIHLATASSAVTYGTVDSGTYADTNTDNDTYWQISPDAVNALDMHSQFLIGVGRIPSAVDFNGRFQGHLSRYCEVDAWNYDTSSWETVSSDSNRIGHATADFDRQFALTPSHVKATDGEMKIRVRSTSITTGDDLYIDKLIIASVAQAAGGLTADAVATTVWNRDVDTFMGAQTAGSRLRRTVAVGTEVSVSNTATSFTVASGKTSANAYRGMEVRIGCSTEDYCETRRIVNWTAGRVVTLDRALSNIPQVGDLVRIMNQYSEVNTTAIEGADPTDTINAACDTALTDYDPPTRAEATTDKDAIITEVNANETKIDTMQGNVTDILTDTNVTIPGTITTLQTDSTAIKAKTDALPSGITKNVALPDFQVYMVLSSDHVTEATGKTITGAISKDGGVSFAALTNAVSEMASGMYKVDITQAEMNADVVTLKFVETDCDQRIITIYTS